MQGYEFNYKLKSGSKYGTLFNQKMFGRISAKNGEKNGYRSYVPGILDDTPYFRIFRGRIFLSTLSGIDFSPVIRYLESYNISTVEKSEDDMLLRTARQVWKFRTKERGVTANGL